MRDESKWDDDSPPTHEVMEEEALDDNFRDDSKRMDEDDMNKSISRRLHRHQYLKDAHSLFYV